MWRERVEFASADLQLYVDRRGDTAGFGTGSFNGFGAGQGDTHAALAGDCRLAEQA
jgi:hypothetical protein